MGGGRCVIYWGRDGGEMRLHVSLFYDVIRAMFDGLNGSIMMLGYRDIFMRLAKFVFNVKKSIESEL